MKISRVRLFLKGMKEKKKEGFFNKLLKNRLGKQSIKGEEILGVELTPSEIRLSQVSSNKANQWVLDKFYVHKFDGISENGTVLENPDKVADELKLAIQKSKINTTNAAIAIPVTSAKSKFSFFKSCKSILNISCNNCSPNISEFFTMTSARGLKKLFDFFN